MMKSTLEEAIAAQIVQVILNGGHDAYGNVIASPVKQALDSWIREEQNWKLVQEAVLKVITPEMVADKVAERVKSLTEESRWYREGRDDFRKKIDEAVMAKATDMLAREQVEKLKELRQTL